MQIVVGLFIGDITDEDYVVRSRTAPMSSFFFAVRSLFTVWADSLVPMAAVAVLVRTGRMHARGGGPHPADNSHVIGSKGKAVSAIRKLIF